MTNDKLTWHWHLFGWHWHCPSLTIAGEFFCMYPIFVSIKNCPAFSVSVHYFVYCPVSYITIFMDREWTPKLSCPEILLCPVSTVVGLSTGHDVHPSYVINLYLISLLISKLNQSLVITRQDKIQNETLFDFLHFIHHFNSLLLYLQFHPISKLCSVKKQRHEWFCNSKPFQNSRF